LFATIIPKKLASRELDASVGASGPHGFAVRKPCHSSFDIARVHRIPSRVRDDREPPLQWDETARFMQVIWVGSEGRIFLAKGLDTDLLCCPSGKFGLPSQQPHRHPEVLAFGEPRRIAALWSILRGAQERAPQDDAVLVAISAVGRVSAA
jgi:hypothetical protein